MDFKLSTNLGVLFSRIKKFTIVNGIESRKVNNCKR